MFLLHCGAEVVLSSGGPPERERDKAGGNKFTSYRFAPVLKMIFEGHVVEVLEKAS
jgi:hypothetical protein